MIRVGILNVHFGIFHSTQIQQQKKKKMRIEAAKKKGKENKFLMFFIFEDFIALSAALQLPM
jgi:quinol-cytochrome oxidoreductase complex cytochrome b subunit